MRSIRIPLIIKFAMGISAIVLIYGVFNALFLRYSVTKILEDEFKKRGFFVAQMVAEKSLFFILSDDPAGLNSLVNEIKEVDSAIHYVFVIDHNGKVLAHTFAGGVPVDLKNIYANTQVDSNSVSVIYESDPNLIIRDFKVAVLNPRLAHVRVGMIENEIIRSVNQTVNYSWIMVGFFFLGGLLAALFFSYTIATPLKVLSNHSQHIDIETIQEGLKTIRSSSKSFAFRIRRIFNSNDEIDLLYSNILSMLERLKQTHQTMNHLQQSLLQAEKMASIGTLTAGVAHEVNNPLAGLRIGLNRIAKHPDNRKQLEEYLPMMQDSLFRMEQVVQDLLTFSRVSPKEREVVCACTLINKSIKLAQYRVRSSKIQIHFDLANCPHKLQVNANQMEQVFLNLLVNSIDAIMDRMQSQPDLEGKISITVENVGNFSNFCFSDNGAGIDPQITGKIFDPFFTTKKTGEGTGLGLSVSYQIVLDHGGKLMVESQPGIGSTFIVSIPMLPSSVQTT